MRIDKVSLLPNFKLPKLNTKKVQVLTFNGDAFEKNNDVIKDYSSITKYDIDWNWSAYRYSDSDFIAYFPLQKKLDIIHASEERLRDIAESLCMYHDSDIVHFTTIFNTFGIGINVKKSDIAFNKMMPYIEKQRTKLVELIKLKDQLETRQEESCLNEVEAKCLKFVSEEIDRIDTKCKNAQKEYTRTEFVEVSDDTEDGFGY